MVDLVKRIKELMDKKGWTSYELSAQTGISTNAIYDWFKIGATPSLTNVVKICEAMDISLEQFFCGEQMYCPSDEEQAILEQWFRLSDLERNTVLQLIETFQVLKSNP